MAAAGGASSLDKNDPGRPLTMPSPTVYPSPSAHDAEEEEASPPDAAAGSRSSTPYLRKRRRRRALWCGGCCVGTTVVVGVVILVLALTVFRVKDPRMTLNNVWLTAVSAGLGTGTGTVPGTMPAAPVVVAANATLTADISIKNPNAAGFRFSQSETDVYYKGQTVSVVYAPAGRVGAHRTARMNITVDLLADDRLAGVVNGTGLVFGQEYDFDTYTAISGKVNVLGIKKHVDIKLNCSIVVQVGGMAAAVEYGVASTVQGKSVNCLAHVSM